MPTIQQMLSQHRDQGELAALVSGFESDPAALNLLPAAAQWQSYQAYIEACTEYQPDRISDELLQYARHLTSQLTHSEQQILLALEGLLRVRTGPLSSIPASILGSIDHRGCNQQAKLYLHWFMAACCLQINANRQASLHIDVLQAHLDEFAPVSRFSILLAQAELNPTASVANLPEKLAQAYEYRLQELRCLDNRDPTALLEVARTCSAALHRMHCSCTARLSDLFLYLFAVPASGPTEAESADRQYYARLQMSIRCLRPHLVHSILDILYDAFDWQQWTGPRQRLYIELQRAALEKHESDFDLLAASAKLLNSADGDKDAEQDVPSVALAHSREDELIWIRGEMKDMLSTLSLSYQIMQTEEPETPRQSDSAKLVDALLAGVHTLAMRQFLFFERPDTVLRANTGEYSFGELLDQALRRVQLLKAGGIRFVTSSAEWPVIQTRFDRRMAEPMMFVLAELAGCLGRKSWSGQPVCVSFSIADNTSSDRCVIRVVVETPATELSGLSPDDVFSSGHTFARCTALVAMVEASQGELSWQTESFKAFFRFELPGVNMAV